MLETLKQLTISLQKENLTWAVGGSLMLTLRGIDHNPNDIDLLVSERDAASVKKILNSLAREIDLTSSSLIFSSTHFAKYSLGDIGIDLMSNFGVKHSEGLYVCPFDQSSITTHVSLQNTAVPLCALEEWYVLYSLMPNRQSKVNGIEEHFLKHGIENPKLLQKALEQPLPTSLQNRIKTWILR
ncbi:nucleotidyltransferase domain-containing protein [Alkalicoccobacillus murimartini]|uniref:Nucleotidyl transferase AbiEii/AbiGii toxin family protein n=1 Tax=Alkalicoccobacillus murimartini TaxID=171685 RepID=A0ABT9YC05_9BACI|nr:hypothetical protein [Alkalicoccobacillus murimartini]MDQ0205373.1 hypothetical protein [Alkalicoccobacillus murimartini]